MRCGIVTSFVTNNDRILILRRSSMGGLWAGVSGMIEDNEEPIHRAKTEIFEEIGMKEESITLIRTSETILIELQNCKLEVFLFEARDPGVRLNWENSEYRWIDAGGLGGYETVPDLQRVLASLL